MFCNSSTGGFIIPLADSLPYVASICEYIALFCEGSMISSSAYTSLRSSINSWIHLSALCLNQMKDAEMQLTEKCGPHPFTPSHLRQPANYTYSHSVNDLVYALNSVSVLSPLLIPSSSLCARLRVGHVPNPMFEWQREQIDIGRARSRSNSSD